MCHCFDFYPFFIHIRDPANPTAKCTKCAKTCLLWEDAKLRDDATVQAIKDEANNDARIGQLMMIPMLF
jgi:hypothetical protein